MLINSYTTGLAPSVLGYLLSLLVGSKYGGKCTWDELGLPVTETGLALPCGATAAGQLSEAVGPDENGFWSWCLLDRAAPGWTRRFRVRQIQD